MRGKLGPDPILAPSGSVRFPRVRRHRGGLKSTVIRICVYILNLIRAANSVEATAAGAEASGTTLRE